MSKVVDANVSVSGAPSPATARSWRDRWHDVRFPVLTFLSVAAVLFVTVWASTKWLYPNPNYPIKEPLVFRGAGLLEGWVRYDGGWYRRIATIGYEYFPGRQSSVAFFPAYPMSMRMVGYATGDVLTAGIVLTFCSGLGMTVLFYRWCCARISTRAARLAVVLLLVFPYAWYLYGAVYADALFLLCILGAFTLLERDRVLLAGLVAAVATAARPTGVGVIIGLIAVLADRRGVITIPYLDRVRSEGWRGARAAAVEGRAEAPGADEGRRILGVRFSWRALRLKDAGILLSAAGLAGWCTYLWVAWGSPTIFAEIEGAPGWDQAQGPGTWFKVQWFELLGNYPEYVTNRDTLMDRFIYTTDVSFQGVLAVAILCALPLVVRRIGWSYAVYVLAVVAIPVLGTKDWQGTGRYLLAAWPVFAALADWLVDTDRRRLRVGLVVVSAAILVLLTSGYARGYYLA